MCPPFTIDNREPNNALMLSGAAPYDVARAFDQFLKLYRTIIGLGGVVYLMPSPGDFQDIPFVANLGLVPYPFYRKLLVSNFTSLPRVGEDGVGAWFFASLGYDVLKCPCKWEGEADLKWLYGDTYVGGYGQRSTIEAYDWMCDEFGMNVIKVRLSDPRLYHLDCSLTLLSRERVLVAASALDPDDLKKIHGVANVVVVPEQYVYDGWTNSIRIGDTILHHSRDAGSGVAFRKLLELIGLNLELIDLSEFDKSGADLSCLVMHLNQQC